MKRFFEKIMLIYSNYIEFINLIDELAITNIHF